MAAHTRQWILASLIIALAALWLAMLLGGVGSLDRSLYEAIYAGHRRELQTFGRILTFLGEPTLLIGASAVCAIWFWIAGRARVGLALLLVTMSGRAVSEAQKYWIARARPDIEPHLVVVKTSSFPSGHAASSMIFYLTLALVLGAHRPWRHTAAAAAILLAFFVGISRVMLGVHWPSDVIGGWAFGLFWVLVTFRPAERLLRTNSELDRDALYADGGKRRGP